MGWENPGREQQPPLCAPGSVTFPLPEPQLPAGSVPSRALCPSAGSPRAGCPPCRCHSAVTPTTHPFSSCFPPFVPWSRRGLEWCGWRRRWQLVASPWGPRCWAAPGGSKILVPKPASVSKAMDLPAGCIPAHPAVPFLFLVSPRLLLSREEAANPPLLERRWNLGIPGVTTILNQLQPELLIYFPQSRIPPLPRLVSSLGGK